MNIKKIITFFLVLTLSVLTFTACTKNNDNSSAPKDEPAQTVFFHNVDASLVAGRSNV